MTAAIAQLMRPSPGASSGGWPARVLTVLALVLPIPLCAALGLSLPLPTTVARIAAKLVPFVSSAVLEAKEEQLLGAQGSIVRYPGELAGNGGSALDPGGSQTVPGPHKSGGAAAVTRGKVDASPIASPSGAATVPAAGVPAEGDNGSYVSRQTDLIAPPTLPGDSTTTPATTPTEKPPPPGGTDPVSPSAPPTVVDTATAAAATVVGTVSTTATTVTSAVPLTVAPVVGVVNGLVGPVLPPKP
jgi:hypothetical protein